MPNRSPRRAPQGATRRAAPLALSRFDRWLNRLVSVSVSLALVVGAVALLLTLLVR